MRFYAFLVLAAASPALGFNHAPPQPLRLSQKGPTLSSKLARPPLHPMRPQPRRPLRVEMSSNGGAATTIATEQQDGGVVRGMACVLGGCLSHLILGTMYCCEFGPADVAVAVPEFHLCVLTLQPFAFTLV